MAKVKNLFDKCLSVNLNRITRYMAILMKNLIFVGHNQVGDAILAYLIIDTLSHYYPDLSVYMYSKNGDNVSAILKKHPNIKSSQPVCTKMFRGALYKDTFAIYQKIKSMLKEGDVYVSSLLGSTTLYYSLFPFIAWLNMTQRNRVHVLHLVPKWFKVEGHIVDFHYRMLSEKLGRNIISHGIQQVFARNKDVQPQTIAILPGASRLWKSLSSEKFARIANHFAGKGYKIKILGSSSKVDTLQAKGIMALADKGVTDLTGKTTLDMYISEIANSSYVITNDSSGQHIAHVCGTPCTVFWGRKKDGVIAKSYSWNTKNTLNIFNDDYQECKKCAFWNRFKTEKQIKTCHKNCEECIKINLELLNINTIIAAIERHINTIQSSNK